MPSPKRSLHHLSARSLDELEREILRMNLITQRTTDIFQVTKIGKEWFAFFLSDTTVFRDYLDAVARRRGLINNE